MADFCQPFIDNIAKETERINELNQLLSDPDVIADPGVKKKIETELGAAQQSLGIAERFLNLCRLTDTDLTGTWEVGFGVYYMRQIGTDVWWVGLSHDAGDPNANLGLAFTNIFQGSRNGDTITGTWLDVPRGATSGSGTLTLVRTTEGVSFHLQAQTGNFTGGAFWTRER
jgi:hypothetical protein